MDTKNPSGQSLVEMIVLTTLISLAAVELFCSMEYLVRKMVDSAVAAMALPIP